MLIKNMVRQKETYFFKHVYSGVFTTDVTVFVCIYSQIMVLAQTLPQILVTGQPR